MTKLQKMRLEVELIDFQFQESDSSLTLDYLKEGKLQTVHLNEERLLGSLDRACVIDKYEAGQVTFGWIRDYYDPTQSDGHGQDDKPVTMPLDIFMAEVFGEADAYDLIRHIEEQKRIKAIAHRMATSVQETLTKDLHL